MSNGFFFGGGEGEYSNYPLVYIINRQFFYMFLSYEEEFHAVNYVAHY